MDQNKLKKLQITLTDMLVDIARVCDENDITYFLSDGALLGAAREGKFIPWDDDIDISMPYEDYLRFLSIGQQMLGEKYFLQTNDTDRNWFMGFSKVRLRNTTFMMDYHNSWYSHGEIFIDVFPLACVSGKLDYKIKNIVYIASSYLLMDGFFHAMKDAFHEELGSLKCMLLEGLYRIPYETRHRWKKRTLNYALSGKQKSRCEYTEAWRKLGGPYPASLVADSPKEIEFEGRVFKTYSDYIAFLETAYGHDWQTPKYKEKGHDRMIIDFEKDYTLYLQ